MLLSGRQVRFLTRISPKMIYGTIVLEAVIGACKGPLPGSLTLIATVFLSMYGVSVANAYAESIREDMASRRVTPLRDKWRAILQPGWVMGSVAVPVTFFGLALPGLITQSTALRATESILAMQLVFFGFVARRLSGAGVLASLWAGTTVALFGWAVVQVKVWAKYLPTIGLG